MGIGGRLKHAWNVFVNEDEARPVRPFDYGASYSVRPDRVRVSMANERSIVTSIYTRIAVDAASVDLRHCRLDEEKRYTGEIDSGLNNCLSLEANIDQTGRALIQDLVENLCDNGVVAAVPIDTSINPKLGSFDIQTMRIGYITQWWPKDVKVSLYNEETGRREEVIVGKRQVAIVQNPLYSVMNEPNSTLQRLIRKLTILDAIDEQSGSGKLDLIIQLPYTIKTETKRQQAQQRRSDIERQLKDGKYGIAYADATEKVIQLNRPAENNLLKQVEYLMTMLYGQLGLTEDVMNGTAEEAAMLNYINRTIEPILGAIAGEMKRKFLTKTAITQGQSIEYFRDPFKLVPMKDLAELADKFTRNEIVSSNEFRGFIGMKPSKDPKADMLVNSNMPQALPPGETADPEDAPPSPEEQEAFDSVNSTLDTVLKDLEGAVNGQ